MLTQRQGYKINSSIRWFGNKEQWTVVLWMMHSKSIIVYKINHNVQNNLWCTKSLVVYKINHSWHPISKLFLTRITSVILAKTSSIYIGKKNKTFFFMYDDRNKFENETINMNSLTEIIIKKNRFIIRKEIWMIRQRWYIISQKFIYDPILVWHRWS